LWAESLRVHTAMELRFIFANHDGVSVEHSFNENESPEDAKHFLMTNWPSKLDSVCDPSRLRLLCMGKELKGAKVTLASLNIPKYEDHPTPVNVSILPKAIPGADPVKQPAPGCCVVS